MSPGEAEWAESELREAEEALRAVEVLIQAELRASAASRLYYAAFHAARAALSLRGLYAKSHSAQITLFEQTFGLAPILGDVFKLRGRADYGRERFLVSLDELREKAAGVAEFVERCRSIVAEAVARGPDEPDPPPDY